MILEYMGKLHKDVQAQKAQAVRIVEYQHLFEVPLQIYTITTSINITTLSWYILWKNVTLYVVLTR